MTETFVVKQAVSGRIYIDTAKQQVNYQLEERSNGGWRFVVDIPRNEEVEEILRMKRELNVFLFRVYEDAPTRKTWFYVNEEPVYYDEDCSRLIIEAGSNIEYVPDDYMS